MNITNWWRDRGLRRDRRHREPARIQAARRFGQTLAQHWLAGRQSAVHALTPGAEDSFVAAAFRHGLIEGTSIRDAAEVAHAVLSGMTAAARRTSRRSRRPAEAACRDAAQRGVVWMAEQVVLGAEADYKLGSTTVEKIRGWSLDRPERSFPA